MHQHELLLRGGTGTDVNQRRGGPEMMLERAQTVRAFGVSAAGVVREHALVENEPRASGHGRLLPDVPGHATPSN